MPRASTGSRCPNSHGNAINRIWALQHRVADRTGTTHGGEPLPASANLRHDVATALADFDRRHATARLSAAIDTVNRHIESTAPWKLLREPSDPDRLGDLLDTYAVTLDEVARAVQPITPRLAVRASGALSASRTTPPAPVFTRLESAPPS